ncbi:PREDICTED: uncharacterized protein LOC105450302 [Wasmannia auropunctata]|uniref:uncharacterized protein LOC105450302 n=1 Tax=Wasmannia auropunctata TaxID=64793 RepID=UPI0005EF0380|nr:PREDICTED: uncharacterized protein LOC105450302 [Wasmannia auropunctata]
MPNSRSQGFIVAEFYDGIQVIPKIWLQSEDLCKYPSHYKTDFRIRKAVEKEQVPTSDWTSFKIDRIFGEYSSLCKADEKAKQALYTSDMDTDKEANRKANRKNRARKDIFSSESEEESSTEVNLPSPPRPPAKRQRLHDENEPGSSSITCSGDSAKRYTESGKLPNSSTSRIDDTSCARNNNAIDLTKENEENVSINQHVEEIGLEHLKRLTREIATVKYDIRQSLTLLDILVKRTNTETEVRNTAISFEGAEDRFPLQTAEQLMEVEEILKHRDSQHNAAIRAYIKSIGGTNVTDAVKRTLYKLFSNKLAERYNWEGRCGKEPLRNLELIKVIFSCVLQNIPDTDHGKIQRRIMEWFRHSKARHQNEEKRKTQGDVGDNAPAESIDGENSRPPAKEKTLEYRRLGTGTKGVRTGHGDQATKCARVEHVAARKDLRVPPGTRQGRLAQDLRPARINTAGDFPRARDHCRKLPGRAGQIVPD